MPTLNRTQASRILMQQQRDERRSAVLALLDRQDAPMPFGMTARMLAERAGIEKHSAAQTLRALILDGVAVKAKGKKNEALYFLAPCKARIDDRAETQAAIALYRAEKQKRVERRQQQLADAAQEMQRLTYAEEIQGQKRTRGGRKAITLARRQVSNA